MSDDDEITEAEVKNLISKSAETIKNYIWAHPGVLYKGIPLVIFLWLAAPALMVMWSWLPWAWASYGIYKTLPVGSLKIALSLFKDKKWLLEAIKPQAVQES